MENKRDYPFRPLMITDNTHALLSKFYGKGRMAAAVSDMVVKATCAHPRDSRIMLRVDAIENKENVYATGFWCKECKQIVSNLESML